MESMLMVKPFLDSVVWQRAIQVGVAIDRLRQGFPREDFYGLASQPARFDVRRFRFQTMLRRDMEG